MEKIILASSSKARRGLMSQLQLPFAVVSPDIDETELAGETAEILVARLTREKGLAVAKNYSNHLIISADQVIVVNGQAISKPETREAAIKQLQSQSGQLVEAFSGLGLLNSATQQFQYACVKTQVLFQSLSLEQIHRYLAKDEQAYHCAGSLRVEALGISLLEKISSDDPTALIGLPLIALVKMLRNESVDVLGN